MNVFAKTEFRIRLLFAIYLSFLTFFAALSFFHQKYANAVVLVVFFFILIGLIYAIDKRGLTLGIKLGFTLVTLPFLVYLSIDGGHQNTAYLWSIPIFISILHVAGFFIGFVASVLYLLLILFLATSGYIHYFIPDRFYAVALAVILLSSIHEYLIHRQSSELTRNMEAKKKQSETDSLTGLLNRRFIDEKIDSWARDNDIGSKALMIVDIDYFKNVNDKLGHVEGDRVLEEVAKAIVSVVRPNDLIGRWGGDEFLVFLEEVQESDLRAICERLLSRVQEIKLSPTECVTVSIGAATADSEFHRLFKEADQGLYFAKDNGRNQFSVKAL
ncbi:hypothetical protein HVMH_2092 [Hydrogenovibrio marinus]|nr:hypothetical protein HVMH_2092 [Hydrogenovibrio marinus]